MSPIKIIVAEENELFREGLASLLKHEPGIEVLGAVAHGQELLEMLQSHAPHVVIADVHMPRMTALEMTRKIRADHPSVAVVALTMFPDDLYIMDMLEAGARGYMLKSIRKEELVRAVRTVHNGGYYFCEATHISFVKALSNSKLPPCTPDVAGQFSPREIEIIQLICQGYSNKQIAPIIQLRNKTVQNYRNRIMEKTAARNTASLVVYAIRHGLFRI